MFWLEVLLCCTHLPPFITFEWGLVNWNNFILYRAETLGRLLHYLSCNHNVLISYVLYDVLYSISYVVYSSSMFYRRSIYVIEPPSENISYPNIFGTETLSLYAANARPARLVNYITNEIPLILGFSPSRSL